MRGCRDKYDGNRQSIAGIKYRSMDKVKPALNAETIDKVNGGINTGSMDKVDGIKCRNNGQSDTENNKLKISVWRDD